MLIYQEFAINWYIGIVLWNRVMDPSQLP